VTGDTVETDRLRKRAEAAIASDDLEGAAKNMERAALMARPNSCLVIHGGPVSLERETHWTYPHGLAYRQYRYPLAEIAAHVSVHAATASRRLKQLKDANV
jgi:hypothetical protein